MLFYFNENERNSAHCGIMLAFSFDSLQINYEYASIRSGNSLCTHLLTLIKVCSTKTN